MRLADFGRESTLWLMIGGRGWVAGVGGCAVCGLWLWAASLSAWRNSWGAGDVGAMVGSLTAGEAAEAPAAHRSSGQTRSDDEVLPGWYAVATAPGLAETRNARLNLAWAAFALERGASLHPGVPARGLRVNLFGQLAVVPGQYRFHLEVEGGQAELTITDDRGAERVRVAGSGPMVSTPGLPLRGPHVLVAVRFVRGTGPGDEPARARLRTLWEREGTGQAGFVREPIPPTAVQVPARYRRAAQAGLTDERGRFLLGQLQCLACHAPAGGAGSAGVVTRPGPVLEGIGARVSPAWLARFIADPQEVVPGCAMPDVLGDSPDDRADIEALTHLLVGWGGPVGYEGAATEAPAWRRGRELYHSVGCVACHGALEPYPRPGGKEEAVEGPTQEVSGRDQTGPQRPFGDLRGKWRPSALAEFLREPTRVRPGGHMPAMSLSEEEADLIATYLVRFWDGLDPSDSGGVAGAAEEAPGRRSARDATERWMFEVDGGTVQRGRAAFVARGCAACHPAGLDPSDLAGARRATPLARLRPGRGCLDPDDRGSPRYRLTEDQRAMLTAGLESAQRIESAAGAGPDAAGPAVPREEVERALVLLGCLNCHEYGGRGGVPAWLNPWCVATRSNDLGDEGRLPPSLTGVGWKLTPSWLRAVLAHGARARPYLATRMPQYGPGVELLAEALASVEGLWVGTDAPEPQANDELVLAGRTLAGEAKLNCVSCHAWAGRASDSMPGPDMTDFGQRLRYEWFRAFVRAPDRFRPGTRMTAFFATGQSPHGDVLNGDAARQIDALWAYATLGRFAPPPEGLSAGGTGLPLQVGDRPLVLRTFLKEAGSRAIAIGYPQGTHFGFDAERVRLVEAWRGDFLDASGAWRNRGGMITGGQGQTIWRAPPGPGLVVCSAVPTRWPREMGRDAGSRFRGYRLLSHGVPVFMYDIRSADRSASPASGADAPVRVEEIAEPADARGSIRRQFVLAGLRAGESAFVALGEDQIEAVRVENASWRTARLSDGMTVLVCEPVVATGLEAGDAAGSNASAAGPGRVVIEFTITPSGRPPRQGE